MLGGCSTLPPGTDYYIKDWRNSQLADLLYRRKNMNPVHTLGTRAVELFVENALDNTLVAKELCVLLRYGLKHRSSKKELLELTQRLEDQVSSTFCYLKPLLDETALDNLLDLIPNKKEVENEE